MVLSMKEQETMIKTRLPVLLAERRLTQKQLSEATKIHPRKISYLYNDKLTKLDMKDLNTLCIFFNVNPGDILIFDRQPQDRL